MANDSTIVVVTLPHPDPEEERLRMEAESAGQEATTRGVGGWNLVRCLQENDNSARPGQGEHQQLPVDIHSAHG